MKNIVSIIFAVAIGGVIGFFGVLVSVFADSGLFERIVTMSIILLVYSILSAVWGFLIPGFSWKWGLFLGTPGVLLLMLYFIREHNSYFLIYIILILGLSCLSAKWGSYIKISSS